MGEGKHLADFVKARQSLLGKKGGQKEGEKGVRKKVFADIPVQVKYKRCTTFSENSSAIQLFKGGNAKRAKNARVLALDGVSGPGVLERITADGKRIQGEGGQL